VWVFFCLWWVFFDFVLWFMCVYFGLACGWILVGFVFEECY